MKNTTLLILALSVAMFSCKETSNKEANENKIKATEEFTEAKTELHEAERNEAEARKEKEIADWNYFKNESDSSIAAMENSLNKIQVNIDKSGQKNKEKLKTEYSKTKSDLVTLKEKLKQKNEAFKKDMQEFNNSVSEKNQSFMKEFKHDMNELEKAIKDVFKDNV